MELIRLASQSLTSNEQSARKGLVSRSSSSFLEGGSASGSKSPSPIALDGDIQAVAEDCAQDRMDEAQPPSQPKSSINLIPGPSPPHHGGVISNSRIVMPMSLGLGGGSVPGGWTPGLGGKVRGVAAAERSATHQAVDDRAIKVLDALLAGRKVNT